MKLEAVMLTLFQSPDDIPEALAALQADPYVEPASVPQENSPCVSRKFGQARRYRSAKLLCAPRLYSAG
jgi:hypothetical protein